MPGIALLFLGLTGCLSSWDCIDPAGTRLSIQPR